MQYTGTIIYLQLIIIRAHSTLCRNILEAAKRTCKKPVQKKEPITIAEIKKIYYVFGGRSCSLLNLRTIAIILIGFSGFMRYSEISDLKRCDFKFQDTHMEIFIGKSKTDMYRDGQCVFIARTNSELCPVSLIRLWFQRANIKDDSEEYIFRALTYYKSLDTYTLRKQDKPISYTTIRELILKVIENIGLDPRKFGLHSLRSGGATSAANNGVTDRLFKRHGRWKSDKAKDGDVKDNLRSLLSVSSGLGL